MTNVYLRVSSADQNVSMQLRDIEAFLKGQEFKVWKDEGFSGKNSSRPALKELLGEVKKGTVKTIVIWKLDRLGRSLADLLTFVKLFNEHGVTLISVRDNLDLSTSQGILFMQMLGAFAEFERSMIIERTKAGIANAKAKGVACGRPSKLSLNTKTSIIELAAKGFSKNHISRSLGVNIGSVHYLLASVKSVDNVVAPK